MISDTDSTSAGPVRSGDGFGEWIHGGKPWSFWKGAGQFLYVCGDLIDDEDPDPSITALLAPLAKSPAIKIGITTDPRSRLEHHRKLYFPHGSWLAIRWLDSHAKVIEAALKELFHPWKCAWETEAFRLPNEVEEWLFDCMDEGWIAAQKQCRLCGDNRVSLIDEIFPRYYPARWLDRRIDRMRETAIAPNAPSSATEGRP